MSNKLTRNELHVDIVKKMDDSSTKQELQVVEGSISSHIADSTSHVKYGAGTGLNTIIVTLTPAPTSLAEGTALSFKNATTNTGAVTLNVNGLGAKPVIKSNGTVLVSGNLRAGSIYTVRYNGTSFILQGEGASGNAVASDLLSGKTASTDAGDITGVMLNQGSVGTQNLTTQNQEYLIPEGYHNGAGKVKATYIAGKRTQNASLSVPANATLYANVGGGACGQISFFNTSHESNGYAFKDSSGAIRKLSTGNLSANIVGTTGEIQSTIGISMPVFVFATEL